MPPSHTTSVRKKPTKRSQRPPGGKGPNQTN
jgi:hypothetical protein